MKKLLYTLCTTTLLTGIAQAETVSILMEGVPDTEYVKALLPEFKNQTGIDVNIEVVNYAEMHTKLVPQLVAQQGSYYADRRRFLLGRRIHQGRLAAAARRPHQGGQGRHLRLRPGLMNLVGKVDGVTYMLPFYNYAMGLTLPQGPAGGPTRTGRLQGQVRHRPARARDLGRVPEAGRVLLGDTEATARSISTARLTRASRPTASPWSGRTTSTPMAAEYYDANWKARSTPTPAARRIDEYKNDIDKYGPLGAAELQLRRGLQRFGPGQGLQLHHLQLLPRRRDDPSKSQVVGKVEIMPAGRARQQRR